MSKQSLWKVCEHSNDITGSCSDPSPRAALQMEHRGSSGSSSMAPVRSATKGLGCLAEADSLSWRMDTDANSSTNKTKCNAAAIKAKRRWSKENGAPLE